MRICWILFSQNELVNNVKVHELLGSSDQIHFNIKVKTGNTYYTNNGEDINIMLDLFKMRLRALLRDLFH